jgi:hypothetical protein
MATTSVPGGSLGVGVGVGEVPPPWNKAPPQQLLLCAVVIAAAVAWCAARALEWAWLRPRRLGRALRAQGLRGTAYRPLSGDAPLADRLSREAYARCNYLLLSLAVAVGPDASLTERRLSPSACHAGLTTPRNAFLYLLHFHALHCTLSSNIAEEETVDMD